MRLLRLGVIAAAAFVLRGVTLNVQHRMAGLV